MTHPARPSLIGREHPAGVLRAEVGRVLESHGGLVFVTGEAGIGKTALAAEAAADAARRGARVLSASCWEGDGAPGYWPWVQVVRDLARTATTDEWSAATRTAGDSLPVLLGEAVPPTAPAGPGPAGADSASFRLHDAFTTLLAGAARSRPTVIVLDDLHWADPASLRLLEFVARHAWFERVLVIGTYRDVEAERHGHPAGELLLPLLSRATTVRLTGLDVAQVGALIARTTGSAPGDGLAAEVHRRTGGNPFFVEQTARLGPGAAADEPVGAGVRNAVERRLALLPPDVTELLRTAALLGHEFPADLLAAAHAARRDAAPGDAGGLLEAALAAGLVTRAGSGRHTFAHDLVRECLYAALGPDGRRAGHAAVVRALGAVPALSPAARAHHARLAVPLLPGPEAAAHLLTAARHACCRLAAEEAVGHYRAALEVAGHGPGRDRAAIELELADELDRAGELTAARETFTTVLRTGRELADAELVARAALGLHRLGNPDYSPDREIGLMDEARDGLERARDRTRDRDAHPEGGTDGVEGAEGADGTDGGQPGPGGGRFDPALTARVLAAGSMARTHRAVDEATGRKLAREAVALARERAGDETLGWCLLAHHDAMWGPGTDAERIAVLDELTAVARRAGDRELESLASFLRTLALLERGSPRGHDELGTFVALTERTRLPRHRFLAVSRRGSLAALSGRFEEARDLMDEARALGEQVGEVDRHRVWRDQVWALELLRGRTDAAEAVARTTTPGDPFVAVLEGFSAAHRGDAEAAARLFPDVEAAMRQLPCRFAPMLLVCRAQLAAATGDGALCEQAREAIAPVADRWAVFSGGGVVWGPMAHWAARVDAAQGRWDAAVAGFTAAAEAADLLGARPWSVLARAHLAGALRARGESGARDGGSAAEAAKAAEAAYAGAADEAAELGMSAALDGLAPPASPSAPASPAPLASAASPAPLASAEEIRTGDARTGSDASAPNVFRPDGQVWTLRYADRTVHVRDAKGLHDLRVLLARPGTEIPATELLDPSAGPGLTRSRRALGADPVLDEEARTAYREHVRRLDDGIRDAMARDDERRAAALDEERAALLDELRRATGLGGRPRRLGDEAERARQTVTARVRDVLRKLRTQHPELAEHLSAAVSTGAYCGYAPERPVRWSL
ncbi:ATPase [Streptomyces armeniacus]|uniref:ATPase n=1 Tax=Streptomyces armeniacus TaxID=83291 RepID=A0A345XR14_9ACTN|nr:AAA family ATPase [Streptomyces armeniacus]AXK34080.1 ATPase [Streptomyces armeniacus]